MTNELFQDIQKLLGVCLMFSKFVQALTQNSKVKEESMKLEMRTAFKNSQEKRKIALQVF